jgi:hypothetical protein
VLSVDPAAGSIRSVTGSPVGQLCGSVAADFSLPYVYDAVGYESQTGGAILAYSLDQTTGELTSIETADVPASTMGMVAVTH